MVQSLTIEAPVRAGAVALSLPEGIRPAVEAHRPAAEEMRRLPAPLVDELRQAGAFGLTTPRERGGWELALLALLDVYEALGRVDGPVAWNVWNGNLGFAAA